MQESILCNTIFILPYLINIKIITLKSTFESHGIIVSISHCHGQRCVLGSFTTAGRYLERVVTGTHNDLYARLIRGLLWPLSMLYCAGLHIYLWVFKKGWRKKTNLDIPVISIGNLTFGGTGKTPTVMAICRMLQNAGYKPVVLSRGHGGSSKSSVIVSNGEDIICSSKYCGDEPLLLARSLYGVPIITGRDRRKSGRLARDRKSVV